ncbi:uncharacterized protein BO87DRAFT_191981 [Aspergillus neoniger CBS 115656]|uniref:Uncharacterized protein n=1 Tax=Aspergillus neoniger (strain CBS 115656) TaxID=1448310 RepID=A0A318YTD1_ASPNB|nr:hypothetical protein BO87DRAFT_191981 [Aspergillus neoniger CBS 115656]PYH37961.1 hypothetical protein BO87DRAFT_191981 [Aspergillus neoniger CBS 115656]
MLYSFIQEIYTRPVYLSDPDVLPHYSSASIIFSYAAKEDTRPTLPKQELSQPGTHCFCLKVTSFIFPPWSSSFCLLFSLFSFPSSFFSFFFCSIFCLFDGAGKPDKLFSFHPGPTR